MYRRRGGVAKQIEKAFTLGFSRDAQAHRAMIQKQAGVQIIGQIDQQPHLPFPHLEELALLGHALILLLA